MQMRLHTYMQYDSDACIQGLCLARLFTKVLWQISEWFLLVDSVDVIGHYSHGSVFCYCLLHQGSQPDFKMLFSGLRTSARSST